MTGRMLTRREGVVEARVSDTELVLLGPDSTDYFGLDAIAADIWGRLAEPCSVEALVADLARDYDAPEATIAADVEPVLNELVDGGLLTRVEDA